MKTNELRKALDESVFQWEYYVHRQTYKIDKHLYIHHPACGEVAMASDVFGTEVPCDTVDELEAVLLDMEKVLGSANIYAIDFKRIFKP